MILQTIASIAYFFGQLNQVRVHVWLEVLLALSPTPLTTREYHEYRYSSARAPAIPATPIAASSQLGRGELAAIYGVVLAAETSLPGRESWTGQQRLAEGVCGSYTFFA
jgi:hypothetical protein